MESDKKPNKSMNKKKYTNALVMVLLNILIGFSIFSIIKTNDPLPEESSSLAMRNLQIELKSIRDQKAILEKELAEVEDATNRIKRSESQENLAEENLRLNIERYQLLLGYKKGNGEGIIITLDENEKNGILANNINLILAVINKLNAAGAEAIAINNERYVFTTDFKEKDGQLYINDHVVTPPLEIRAIGNSDTLEATMNFRYGILYEIRSLYGIDATVEKSKDIEVPQYSGNIRFDYAHPVEGKE